MRSFIVFFIFLTLSTLLNAEIKPSNHRELRVVALAPHIVENLYAIGAGKHIVGTVDYADFPAEANNIPSIGGYYGLHLEKILALKPDLIIAWQSGNKMADIAQLQRLGFNVVFSEAKSLDKVADELLQFGELLGYQQQANNIAQQFTKRLKHLKKQYSQQAKIKVFYQLWPEPMRTINKNTIIDQIISICRGDNVFADNATDYPQVSIENVIVAQPELIILPDEKSKQPQPIIAWQKWPEIPAVKANAFIHVNADLLHRFSVRSLDGVASMCEKMDNYRPVITGQK